MSRHSTTRGPAAVTTSVALASLIAGFAVGIPAALYGITHDWDSTTRTIGLAMVITGLALVAFFLCWVIRCLCRPRRQR